MYVATVARPRPPAPPDPPRPRPPTRDEPAPVGGGPLAAGDVEAAEPRPGERVGDPLVREGRHPTPVRERVAVGGERHRPPVEAAVVGRDVMRDADVLDRPVRVAADVEPGPVPVGRQGRVVEDEDPARPEAVAERGERGGEVVRGEVVHDAADRDGRVERTGVAQVRIREAGSTEVDRAAAVGG